MTTQSVTIPTSILINGLWQAAHWSAQVLDDDTGEILLTAVAGSTQIAVRLTMDNVALLRQTLPAFAQANARRDAQAADGTGHLHRVRVLRHAGHKHRLSGTGGG